MHISEKKRGEVRGAGESMFLLAGFAGGGGTGGRLTGAGTRRVAQGKEGALFPQSPRSD